MSIKTDNKKNKVYFATADEDCGGVYIAAKNIRIAKSIAHSCDLICEHIENYIDLKIHMCKGVRTDYEGELDIEQIVELGIAWWSCENKKCYSDNIEIIDNTTYKCKNCKYEGQIPYVNS